MRVYIQLKDGYFVNENAYCAYYGFNQLGYEIIPFIDTSWLRAMSLGRTKEDIVVGNIGVVVQSLLDIGIAPPPQLATPPELEDFLGRKTGESTLGEIRDAYESFSGLKSLPIFIKPKDHHKLFDGYVVKDFNGLIYTSPFPADTKVITSEVVNFISEYRGFVLNGELIGCKHYKGDFKIHPDYTVIHKAIDTIKKPLVAYSIDFGVTNQGETFLIECNDSFSLGAYGIKPRLYVQMIKARWEEMTK